jgi:hypothetical protein
MPAIGSWLAVKYNPYFLLLKKRGEKDMKRMFSVLAAVFIGLTTTPTSVLASAATDALVTCVIDKTTGKDRKDMARWMFVVMSAHPGILSLSNVSEKDRDQINGAMAALATRLLTEDCRVQTKLAIEKDGDQAPLKITFGELGKLSMQELINNSNVDSAAMEFGKYVDRIKLKRVFSDK